MKKRRYRYLVLLILILYSSSVISAVDPIGDIVEGLTPKPVYSILDGLEKVKMANSLDQLSILNDTYAESEEQKQYQLDTVRLVSILLGNSNITRRIDRTAGKIVDMDIADWVGITGTDIRDILIDMTGGVVVEDTKAKPTEKQQKEIATMIAVSSGVKKKDAKAIIDKVDEAVVKKQIEDEYLEKLAAETQTTGINDEGKVVALNIENSTPAFIDEKQEQLKKLDKALYDAEMSGDTSLIQQVKINNQLQLLNAQISLKILNSLNLINEGDYVELVTTRKQRLEQGLEGLGEGY